MHDPPANEAIHSLIASIVRTTRKRDRARDLAALRQLSPEVVAPPIIEALQRATSKNEFFRLCYVLAELGGEMGVEHLLREARENARFPRHPIRALAHSKHPAALPVLIDLMATGKKRQRRSAMIALSECGSIHALEPLCNAARKETHHELRNDALRLLRRMGRPGQLAQRALQDETLTDAACARIVIALEVMPAFVFPLLYAPFEAEPFLARAARRKGDLRRRAQAALDRVTEVRTLLRPAEASAHGDHLLRAVTTIHNARPDELLRASDLAPGDTPAVRGSWLNRILDLLSRC